MHITFNIRKGLILRINSGEKYFQYQAKKILKTISASITKEMDIIIWKPVHYGQFIQVFELLYKERYSELCFTLHHSQAPDVIYFSNIKTYY